MWHFREKGSVFRLYVTKSSLERQLHTQREIIGFDHTRCRLSMPTKPSHQKIIDIIAKSLKTKPHLDFSVSGVMEGHQWNYIGADYGMMMNIITHLKPGSTELILHNFERPKAGK